MLLHRTITEFIGHPDTNARLAKLGYEPIASTPEQFAERIKTEIASWAEVIAAAQIQVN
jgi:tripartite-type tricarboxylate transporter receptor subunit TctC